MPKGFSTLTPRLILLEDLTGIQKKKQREREQEERKEVWRETQTNREKERELGEVGSVEGPMTWFELWFCH